MEETVKIINEQTSLPFKVVVPIVAAIVAATIWIQSTIASVRYDYSAVVRREEWREWRNALADRNRTLDVPYLPAPATPR